MLVMLHDKHNMTGAPTLKIKVVAQPTATRHGERAGRRQQDGGRGCGRCQLHAHPRRRRAIGSRRSQWCDCAALPGGTLHA